MKRLGRFAHLMCLIAIALTLSSPGCRSAPEPKPTAAVSAPAEGRLLSTTQPVELPGLHQVLEVTPGLVSGSSPEGEAGFASLRRLGVRTVITVDGARPEAGVARAHGLRYVHIPVGYDGIPADKQRRIARAVRDLPGPVYIHCHHGKHRGPAAAASAAVLLGRISGREGVEFMARAGTAEMYSGLYGCVAPLEAAAPSVLDAVPADFPEAAEVSGFVEAMVRIDQLYEHLQLVREAGWRVPKDHPDLVPHREALMLGELMAGQHPEAQRHPDPAKFLKILEASRKAAGDIARLLQASSGAGTLDNRMEALRVSCRDCHREYRDRRG